MVIIYHASWPQNILKYFFRICPIGVVPVIIKVQTPHLIMIKSNQMEQTVNFFEKGQRGLKALNSLGAYLAKSPVEQSLLNLIYFRVSQLNGCAFCLDMHSKDLRAEGETEQRLFLLNAWCEAPFYTERERAALAWAEALTKLNGGAVDAATTA